MLNYRPMGRNQPKSGGNSVIWTGGNASDQQRWSSYYFATIDDLTH